MPDVIDNDPQAVAMAYGLMGATQDLTDEWGRRAGRGTRSSDRWPRAVLAVMTDIAGDGRGRPASLLNVVSPHLPDSR